MTDFYLVPTQDRLWVAKDGTFRRDPSVERDLAVTDGYVKLTDGNNLSVARALALTFLDLDPESEDIAYWADGYGPEDGLEGVAVSSRSERWSQLNVEHRSGGSQPGEANKGAKLTEDDVHLIRQGWASGMTQVALSGLYGVSLSQIRNIVHRRQWTHI